MELHENDFALLDAMDDDLTIKMPERDFRRLLPYLVSVEDGKPVQRDMGVVIAACQGNPHRSIEVFDDKGNTLFIMPPLAARSPTAVPPKEGDPDMDIGELTAIYDARIGVEPPHMVNEWYQNMLVGRSYSPEQSLLATYVQQWIQIYRYYKIPLEYLLGEKAEFVGEQKGGPVAEKENKGGGNYDDLTDDDFEAI